MWVGDCFIYTNSENRLNYHVGGEIVTISHLDRTQYILGYIAKDSKLYLGDKDLNVTSFALKTAGIGALELDYYLLDLRGFCLPFVIF